MFDQASLAILAAFGLVVLVLALIPGLADAASRAVASLRDLRRTIRGQSVTAQLQADDQAEQKLP